MNNHMVNQLENEKKEILWKKKFLKNDQSQRKPIWKLLQKWTNLWKNMTKKPLKNEPSHGKPIWKWTKKHFVKKKVSTFFYYEKSLPKKNNIRFKVIRIK